MVVWILLVIYILFAKAIIGSVSSDFAKKRFLRWVGIATFLVIGLRGDNYNNVYDLRVYKGFYEIIMSTSWTGIFNVSDFEPGYVLVNKILSTVFPFSQMIVLFEAAVCVFAVCFFIYHNSNNVFFAFFFYVTLGSMGFMLTGLRQSIAISICLICIEYIKRGDNLKYILGVLLAFLIHNSAIVMLPLYYIARNKTIIQRKWSLIFVVLFMMLFAPYILELGKWMSAGELVAANEPVYSFNGIIPILLYCIGLFGQIIYERRESLEKKECLVLSSMIAVGLGLYMMRFYNEALERLAWFYTQASYIGLANFYYTCKKDRMLEFVKIVSLVMAFLLFFKRLQTADYAAYVFFWS